MHPSSYSGTQIFAAGELSFDDDAACDPACTVVTLASGDEDTVEDMWAVDVLGTQRVAVTLDGAAIDLDLYLIQGGSVLALDVEPTNDAMLLLPALPAGRYYLGVSRAWDASGTTTYRLRLTPYDSPTPQP